MVLGLQGLPASGGLGYTQVPGTGPEDLHSNKFLGKDAAAQHCYFGLLDFRARVINYNTISDTTVDLFVS